MYKSERDNDGIHDVNRTSRVIVFLRHLFRIPADVKSKGPRDNCHNE